MRLFPPQVLGLLAGAAGAFFCALYLAALARQQSALLWEAGRGFSRRAAGAFALWAAFGAVFGWAVWAAEAALWSAAALAFLFVMFAAFLPLNIGRAFSVGVFKKTDRWFGSLAEAVGATLGALLQLPGLLLLRFVKPAAGPEITEEQVLSVVDSAKEQDVIDETQQEMIANIVELDEVNSGDAMTHRTDIVAVEENTAAEEAVRLAREEGVSRLPVYRKTLDDVRGVLYVKDLFALIDDPAARTAPVSGFMRPPMFVPESLPVRQLLIEFRKKHTQIAIVVDEYGGTSGLVTMEDLLEEIVGDIQDEFDDEEALITETPEGLVCDGAADPEDVFPRLSLLVPAEYEDQPFDSLGGLVIDQLGYIPLEGQKASFTYAGACFEVLEVKDRRVSRVRCRKGDCEGASAAATPQKEGDNE